MLVYGLDRAAQHAALYTCNGACIRTLMFAASVIHDDRLEQFLHGPLDSDFESFNSVVTLTVLVRGCAGALAA